MGRADCHAPNKNITKKVAAKKKDLKSQQKETLDHYRMYGQRQARKTEQVATLIAEPRENIIIN